MLHILYMCERFTSLTSRTCLIHTQWWYTGHPTTSRHICKHVTSRVCHIVWTSDVTHLLHSHTGATRGTHQRQITYANTSRHTYVADMNHSHHTCTFLIYLQLSDTGHSPISRHKCERVTSHICICLIHTQRCYTGHGHSQTSWAVLNMWLICHVSHVNHTSRAPEAIMCDMAHFYVTSKSHICPRSQIDAVHAPRILVNVMSHTSYLICESRHARHAQRYYTVHHSTSCQIRHVTGVSCLLRHVTYVMSLTCASHVTHMSHTSHTNRCQTGHSCMWVTPHTHVMSHMWASHVTHIPHTKVLHRTLANVTARTRKQTHQSTLPIHRRFQQWQSPWHPWGTAMCMCARASVIRKRAMHLIIHPPYIVCKLI